MDAADSSFCKVEEGLEQSQSSESEEVKDDSKENQENVLPKQDENREAQASVSGSESPPTESPPASEYDSDSSSSSVESAHAGQSQGSSEREFGHTGLFDKENQRSDGEIDEPEADPMLQPEVIQPTSTTAEESQEQSAGSEDSDVELLPDEQLPLLQEVTVQDSPMEESARDEGLFVASRLALPLPSASKHACVPAQEIGQASAPKRLCYEKRSNDDCKNN